MLLALTAISFGTVIQKRYLEHMEILGGNTIQAISAAIFFALVLILQSLLNLTLQ